MKKENNLIEITDLLLGEEGYSLEQKLNIFSDMIIMFKQTGDEYNYIEEIVSDIKIEIRDRKLLDLGI